LKTGKKVSKEIISILMKKQLISKIKIYFWELCWILQIEIYGAWSG
jgi:hypothetical protein